MSHTYVAIMAGGVGSRFWPGSRVDRPKQFLDMLGTGKSLIRHTFERATRICPAENVLILTNARYKDQVLEHLPEITENQILCEPSRNNTAPCIAYTAFKLKNLDPKATFVVLPSDASIKNEDEYVRVLKSAVDFAQSQDVIVTVGITPTRPDQGYGYINFEKNESDAFKKVIQFTEKPDEENAIKFYESGEYLWNAGIFVWSVATILKSYKEHATDIYDLFESLDPYYNTDEEQSKINEWYPKSRNISVDYAIMQPSKNIYTIPAEFGWSDLGTWNSLYKEATVKDENENVVVGDDIILQDSSNCLIRKSKEKLMVLRGLDDFIVIDEGDVLMIYPKSKEQEIKELTERIKNETGDKYL